MKSSVSKFSTKMMISKEHAPEGSCQVNANKKKDFSEHCGTQKTGYLMIMFFFLLPIGCYSATARSHSRVVCTMDALS